jgi:hypothetical protein
LHEVLESIDFSGKPQLSNNELAEQMRALIEKNKNNS